MPPDPPLDVLRVPMFQGRNTFVSPHDIQPTESPDDLNVDGETPGQLRKRRGIAKFSTTQLGTDAITGLYRYYRTNGDRFLMALCGTQLWSGAGTPPDLHVVKTGLTAGSWMTFVTNQDFCYGANYFDQSLRFDGLTMSHQGVAAPETRLGPIGAASNTATGRLTSSRSYCYRFVFVYGKLGASNLSPNAIEAYTTVADNTITLLGLELFRPGSGGTETPAEAGQPTKLRIYRTVAYTDVFFSHQEWEPLAMKKPFYLVAEIDYPLVGAVSYTDIKGDDELLGDEEYPGHNFSEPYLDRWMNVITLAWHAVREGYLWTPRARYLCEHRNRIWAANIQQTDFKAAMGGIGTQNPFQQFPNRVYWTKEFQPDAFEDFVDVQPEDGDFITGLASIGEYLVVFKTRGIYAIFGSGPSSFEVKVVDTSAGCMAPRTIVQMEHATYFLGKDGVYAFDGGPVRRISENIRPDILAIKKVDREFAAAGQWNGRYYLAFKEPT